MLVCYPSYSVVTLYLPASHTLLLCAGLSQGLLMLPDVGDPLLRSSSSIALVQPLVAFPDISHFLSLAGACPPLMSPKQKPHQVYTHHLVSRDHLSDVLTDLICFILDSGSGLLSSFFLIIYQTSQDVLYSLEINGCGRLTHSLLTIPKDPKVLVTLISVTFPANVNH